MKKKTICILALCVLSISQAFALESSFKKRTESWLLRTDPPSTGTEEPPVNEPDVTPVGDGVWLILGLCSTYGFYLFNKNRKLTE